MSYPLIALTRTFAETTNPQTMTLAEIDRLHNAITTVITDKPTHVDLIALDQLADNLDTVRRKRRLGHKGHITGQRDIYGKELAA